MAAPVMDDAALFGFSPGLPALRQRVRDFVEQVLVPQESAALAHDLPALDALARRLQAQAREAGLYAPHLPAEWGGLGLNWRDRSVVLEEAGRSVLGPLALNCAPPDQPNMMQLLACGSPAQQQRYLAPLARGEQRSCFAMTEPEPGAGSDPAALLTTATPRRGGGWVLNGRKWFISGAVGAAFALVLARTGPGQASTFIVDADRPGYRVLRAIPAMDGFQIGGHGEIELADCLVPDDAMLGQPGQGFADAQRRLEPARLSHCLRFIGRASRAMSLAQDYALRRQSFGQPLSQLQQVQAMVADSHIELQAARLMAWHAAARLDAGLGVQHESALAKVFVSEAVGRVADRAAQIMGALGMSDDTPVAGILRELRPFRIYDGASELHRATLARRIFREGRRA